MTHLEPLPIRPLFRPAVLVVEDEALLRLDTMEIVEEAGFEAIEARDADQAMRIMCERADVAALLTDVDMPGSMNGLALARTVAVRWSSVVIVVASGRATPTRDELPCGGVFLPKPYLPASVVAALETCRYA